MNLFIALRKHGGVPARALRDFGHAVVVVTHPPTADFSNGSQHRCLNDKEFLCFEKIAYDRWLLRQPKQPRPLWGWPPEEMPLLPTPQPCQWARELSLCGAI